MITLMDNLLRHESLDLKLTPYRVLATGSNHGMAQFVPSLSLANIISQHGGIESYLKKDGVIPSLVMDTYVKSCGTII